MDGLTIALHVLTTTPAVFAVRMLMRAEEISG